MGNVYLVIARSNGKYSVFLPLKLGLDMSKAGIGYEGKNCRRR